MKIAYLLLDGVREASWLEGWLNACLLACCSGYAASTESFFWQQHGVNAAGVHAAGSPCRLPYARPPTSGACPHPCTLPLLMPSQKMRQGLLVCALQVNASFSSSVNMAQPQSPPPAAHHGSAPSLGQQFFTHVEVTIHCIQAFAHQGTMIAHHT